MRRKDFRPESNEAKEFHIAKNLLSPEEYKRWERAIMDEGRTSDTVDKGRVE